LEKATGDLAADAEFAGFACGGDPCSYFKPSALEGLEWPPLSDMA
jgi:hypothetical protein